MMLKNFESFNSDKEKYLEIYDINYLFSDFLDSNYTIQFFHESRKLFGVYDIQLKKQFSEGYFDYLDYPRAWGNNNLEKIKKELDLALEQLKQAIDKLSDMEYTVLHEFEFNFSESSYIEIRCHIQHSKYNNED